MAWGCPWQGSGFCEPSLLDWMCRAMRVEVGGGSLEVRQAGRRVLLVTGMRGHLEGGMSGVSLEPVWKEDPASHYRGSARDMAGPVPHIRDPPEPYHR